MIFEKQYQRHGKIGGTLACVIAHGDHFGRTPYKEWQVFMGENTPEDLSNKFPVQLGIQTEGLNADFFSRRSGLRVDRSSEARGLHTSGEGYLVCQPDGLVRGLQGDLRLFEAKHTSSMSDMDTQIERYYPQLQHNMYVTHSSSAFLSVIFGTREPEYCEIERDENWLSQYLPLAADFWRHVMTKTPPSEGYPIPKGDIKITGRMEISSDHPSHNVFHNASVDYLEYKEPAKKFEEAKASLKEVAPKDMKVTVGQLVEVRRDKRGAATIRERRLEK